MTDLTADVQVEGLQTQDLAAILELKNRAEAATLAAEEANRKANSESGFAYNAKQNAEDHAKAIAQVRGTVEADFNWLTTTKKNATDATEAIEAARKTAENEARITAETRAASETMAAAVRATQEKSAVSLAATEKAREEIEATAKRATEDAAAVTQARANSEAASSAVQAVQVQVSDLSTKVQTDAAIVSARNTESNNLLNSMRAVVETATNAHERIREHEETITRLAADFGQLHSKIESLLPGATSAGLASAFRDQKSRFDRPQRIWLWTFGITMVILFAVGALGFGKLLSEPVMTWDSFRIHVISRFPIAIPLVWMALYAGRHYTLALRLQEDYAYKEAISTAFEGYRREMTSIPVSGEQLLPVLTLCDNVLKTLGQRPGRLYDGKHDDVTPLTPIKGLLPRIFGSDKGAET